MTWIFWLRRVAFRMILGTVGILLVLLLWQTGYKVYGAFVLPSVDETIKETGRMLCDHTFLLTVGITAMRALTGFFCAIMTGSVLGVVCGHISPLRQMVRPVVMIILGIPPIAWIVLALIWFGSGGGSAILTVAISSFPLSFAAGLQGVLTRDPRLDEMASSFGVSSWKRFRTVTYPHLISYLLPAWSVTFGSAWKVTVMAELLANSGGLGGEMATARALFDIPRIMALVMLLAGFSLFSEFVIIHPLREYMERWRKAGHQVQFQ